MGYETLCYSLYDQRDLVSAIVDKLREFFRVCVKRMPGHRLMVEMSHAAGRPYLLHSCGNLSDIMDDLIEEVRIDAKHSFEDTIEDVRQVKHSYGRKIALLGGIDVNFLCRSDEQAIRKRVRQTLDVCQQDGGYCLGTGSVANYIPLDNYLTMLDEGRLYAS
jgi:uroporphyrinogen decarboxylase